MTSQPSAVVIDPRARSEIKYAIDQLRRAERWLSQAHATAIESNNPGLTHELENAQELLGALRQKLIVARRP
jgi:hypothetical protein